MKEIENIETERLILRPLDISDAKTIFELRSSDEVNKYLDRKKAVTRLDAEEFIEKIFNNTKDNKSYYWAITLKPANNLIGTICLWGFTEDGEKAEIGFELLPAHQRTGIMNEALHAVVKSAFSNLKLKTIEAYSHPDNVACNKLLDKNNFKRHFMREDRESSFNFIFYKNR